MISFFIILQFTLLIFMLFHDWIPVPPFNDVKSIKLSDKLIQSTINGVTVSIPIILTLTYHQQSNISFNASINILIVYSILTVGSILSWWVPYLFGSSEKHKQQFSKFKNTHHFIPARGDNIIPNTLHVILHAQIWICLAISIYFCLSNII